MNIEVVTPYLAYRPNRVVPCTTIVMHSSAGASAKSSIAWLRKPEVGLSYHYIIERDGLIYKCVPVSGVAFHAGQSVGPNGKYVNRYSIGVCFANNNQGEIYYKPQVDAAIKLVKHLADSIETIEFVTSHKIISPGRKTDPAGFDMRKFSEDVGIKLWNS